MGVADKVWGDYPVYYKQPLRVCTARSSLLAKS